MRSKFKIKFKHRYIIFKIVIKIQLAINMTCKNSGIAFDIVIPFEEISNENFNSVDSILALVQRLMNE